VSDMDDLDLLTKLAESDCLYAKSDRPPRQVLDQAKEAFGTKGYELAFAAILGQVSGHEWCYCSECRAIRLMEPTGLKRTNAKTYTDEPPAAHPYCKLTPRCLGHMVRIAKRPVLTERLRQTLNVGLREMIHAV
jgi:hypothetical protein